jgi:hypothetical protein
MCSKMLHLGGLVRGLDYRQIVLGCQEKTILIRLGIGGLGVPAPPLEPVI